MGSCFSFDATTSISAPTAKVIALDGSLKEFSMPVTVSFVLKPDHQSCFLCNSDSLYFDTYIPALPSNSILQLNQIYFVLPIAKLDYPLSGSDMAAMAIKAGSALARDSKKKHGKGQRIRVTPVAQVICEKDFDREEDDHKLAANSGIGKRPDHVRARTPSRSPNRVRLDTIEEI